MDVTRVCGSLGLWNSTQHIKPSAVYPAAGACSVNGSPVDRFSKERQACGERLGRLPGKDGLGTGLRSLGRLWMNTGWKQAVQVGSGQTLDADTLLCNP